MFGEKLHMSPLNYLKAELFFKKVVPTKTVEQFMEWMKTDWLAPLCILKINSPKLYYYHHSRYAAKGDQKKQAEK